MEDTKDKGPVSSRLKINNNANTCDVENDPLEPIMNDDESLMILYGNSCPVVEGQEELNSMMEETNNEEIGDEEIMNDDENYGDYDEDYINEGVELGDEDPEEEANYEEDGCEEVMDGKVNNDIVQSEEEGQEAKELDNEENVNEEVMNEECMKHDKEVEEYGGGEDKGHLGEGDTNVENASKEKVNAEAKNGKEVKFNANKKVGQLRKAGKLAKKKKMNLKGKKKAISSEANLNLEVSNEETLKEKVETGTQGVEEKKQHVDAKVVNKGKENREDQRGELKRQVETVSKDKSGKLRKRGKKGAKKKKVLNGMRDLISKNTNGQETANNKMVKKGMSTGMIFMCSSQTKMDCYRFKILGLPASKRDIVLNIYEGMKLFLFDFDLKLLYGIYRAAGPGGYNIEPKAFNSGFPSQVRFNVSEDCLPLPEEKFKNVIKENYYSKNKFDCQLTSEQVNNLCKLFRATSRGSKLNGLNRAPRPEPHALDVVRPRKRRAREEPRNEDRGKKQRRNEDRTRKPHRGQERKSPVRREQWRRERKAHTPPVVPRPLPLPPHPPSAPVFPQAYAYDGERSARRDALDLDMRHREHIERGRDPIHPHYNGYFLDSEFRHQEEIKRCDPYDRYRDYPLYRDQMYPTAGPSTYHRTAGSSLHPRDGRVEYCTYNRYNSTGRRRWY